MMDLDAPLLLHPVIGETAPHDIDVHTRVKCCRAILPEYPQNRVLQSLLLLRMRMAGPREAILHALVAIAPAA